MATFLWLSSIDSEQREHAAGLSFFGAIGVITIQIASGAYSGAVNFFYAERATLLDDLRCEINFIVWRTNAGAELNDHVRRFGAEAINHFSDCAGHDAGLGTSSSGMHETDCRRFGINDINCATVSDVDTQCHTTLIRDYAVAAGKFADW